MYLLDCGFILQKNHHSRGASRRTLRPSWRKNLFVGVNSDSVNDAQYAATLSYVVDDQYAPRYPILSIMSFNRNPAAGRNTHPDISNNDHEELLMTFESKAESDLL